MKVCFLLAAVALLLTLAACDHAVAPVRLYFIASSRFTSSNRLGVQPADTLATRLFAVADSASGKPLRNIRVEVTYSPTYQPFAYDSPITAFVYSRVPAGETTVYLDTTFAQPGPGRFLLTSVFGVRTTSGAERWTYTATDTDRNTSVRSFAATVRRTDSTQVYHDYLLRLNVPARGVGARRFIQLRPGLALPAYAVIGTSSNPLPAQRVLTDVVQSADGLSLFSPDSATIGTPPGIAAWDATQRRNTRFALTTLDATGFGNLQDTASIRQQMRYPGRAVLRRLVAGQVYAFRTYPIGGSGQRNTFGLLRVVSVPGGTTAGLQLQVRLAKQRL